MKQNYFPQDFCEYESNEIEFDDHSVSYDVEGLYTVFEWHIIVTKKDGRSSGITVVQYAEDSAKYTFLDAYQLLCRSLEVTPAKFE